jgi:NAD(P)-dependent dehydrogenase (short-subunit alcohol dehydrogenase family)
MYLSFPMAKSVVVTGANRGLGGEFARQLSALGHRVIGTVRRPDAARELRELGVTIEPLDLADDASIDAFARRLDKAPVDALIHNAAIGDAGPLLEGLSVESLERNYRVNAIGPLRLTRSLLKNLRVGTAKQVIAVSSTAGSVSTNETRGGWYAYRASKAALNQLFRTMALELGPEGFTCVLLSPGWVRTDMGGPKANLSAEESVRGMIEVWNRLTPADNNSFLDYRGQKTPW